MRIQSATATARIWWRRRTTALDPEALTIGFARRFATYKRANLIFSDLERLSRAAPIRERPVQLVFSGKAHPADHPGRSVLRRCTSAARRPSSRERIVFVEDYDINVGRHLVQGVDVWLNNPRRPQEASGTSGQKVLLNGGLNFSVLDGWWAEAYDGLNGFAIGDGITARQRPRSRTAATPSRSIGRSRRRWSRSTTTATSMACRAAGSRG